LYSTHTKANYKLLCLCLQNDTHSAILSDVDGETNDREVDDDNDDCAEKARPRRRRRIADRATAFMVEIFAIFSQK